MRRSIIPVVPALILVLGMAACGDDDRGATTAAPETTVATTTTPTTAAAPTTTTAASTTTTTAAPTTTTTSTTTLPLDAHPVFGVSWATVWPPDGSTATYQVVSFDGVTGELPARIDYGVEWKGGTWDRFTIGDPGSGEDAMVVYLNRPEPWVFVIGGVESYTPNGGTEPFSEWFDEPLMVDTRMGLGETFEAETTITLQFPGDSPFTLGVEYTLTGIAVDETLELAFGTLEDVVHLEATVGGAFIGGPAFTVEIWVHAGQFLLKMDGPPSFQYLELIESWG